MAKTRQAVVSLANSWLGKKESNGSFKSIIDIYNGYKGKLPRGVKMQYSWEWCAATWSALAIKLGYTDIMPIEISCGQMIEVAKKMGCWVENDKYIASPGDAILYDWQDTGVGDNAGWPDHIGVIVEANSSAGYYVVVEGNYDNEVKKRTISINGRYLRGFITPKYDKDDVKAPEQQSGKDITTVAREVIAGTWDKGANRQKQLESKGYNYRQIQDEVNRILNGNAVKPITPTQDQNQPSGKKVIASSSARNFASGVSGTYKTTANVYCRNDAGTNKKALCLIPKGTKVNCYGYFTYVNGIRWLYIQVVMDRVMYTGFVHSSYLKK